jgi:hypothetical protein
MEPWYTKIAGLIPRKFVIGVLILAFFYVVGNFSDTDSGVDETVRDTTGEVVEAGTVDALILQLGDCLVFPSDLLDEPGTVFTDMEVVPCTELHDAQIGGEHVMDDGDFPGLDFFQNSEDLDGVCIDKYIEFTKTSLTESPHLVSYFYPTEDSWLQGDRTVQCIFMMADGEKLGASLEG